MISYKEEYFKTFEKEKIFNSLSFKSLKNNLNTVTFYGPYQDDKEQAFVKEAKEILDIISSIIVKPHITIKGEDSIIRSELATNVDPNSYLKTLADPSLWKRKNGKMSPEQVYTRQTSDTYVLYENILMMRILDFINDELLSVSRIYEKRVGNLRSYFECEAFNYNQYGVLALLNKMKMPVDNILYKGDESVQTTSKSLSKALKKCSTLKSTAFYKEVSKAKTPRKEIILTNILLNDRRYYTCYKFYKKYISSQDENYFLPLYQDYILLRIFNDLKDDYTFSEVINRSVNISYDKGFKFNKPIHIQDKMFTYSFEKDNNEYGIIIKVKPKKEKNKEAVDDNKAAKHYLIITLELNNDNYKHFKNEVDKKRSEGYDNVVIVTLRNNTNHYNNIMNVSFYKDDDTLDAIKNLFSSFHLMFDCDLNTYANTCPLCGKRSVHSTELNFVCSGCHGTYTTLEINAKQYLWIKGFGGK